MSDYELVITEGKLPYWRAFLATVFVFVFALACVVSCWPFFEHPFNEATFTHFANGLFFVGIGFSGMVYFAFQKSVFIDVDQNLLISRFNVGPVTWQTKTDVPTLEYVSFFLQSQDLYTVNLWYEGNKHYKMYTFTTLDDAREFARYVSKKLAIDLLDATQPGNSKWMEN